MIVLDRTQTHDQAIQDLEVPCFNSGHDNAEDAGMIMPPPPQSEQIITQNSHA